MNLIGNHGSVRTPVSVLLADDHHVWRGAMRSYLEDTEFEVVGEAGSGSEAVVLCRAVNPRLVLMDIRMPDGDGLDALCALKQECPLTSVIMLTTYENPGFLHRAIAGGAAGYLLKGLSREELLLAMQTVVLGGMLVSQQDLLHVLREIRTADPVLPPRAELAAGETDLLCLMCRGLHDAELAAALRLSEEAIRSQVHHVISKIGVSDRVQATAWATRAGLS